ncbi:MAG TPA: N,N-dimethylformamidase beta subunit family domain-containing protein [Opitutus sp.]|nr:N,N-dimethylformamidase beta subunit family domain-containing protein [Opitutus sp.]
MRDLPLTSQSARGPASAIRRVLPVAALLAVLLFPFAAGAADSSIVSENQRRGTKDWLLTKVDAVLVQKNVLGEDSPHFARSKRVEGFASQTSYRAGDKATFFISAEPASNVAIDIYRMGYYQGNGGRHVRSVDAIPVKPQPTPDDGERNLRECKWSPAHEFTVPSDWLSGVYLAKLTRADDGFQSYIVFVVRDDRKADFNFQVSDMTWQAYNRWPAWRSLYDFQGKLWNTSGGDIVSFDRPYTFFYNLLPSAANPLTNGSGEFLLWELPLAFWMEEQGYDVTYTSTRDTHRDAPGLLRTKAFLSVGHDEYWTRQMYDNVARARDEGVNLLFLSGNAVDGEVFLTTSTDGRPDRIMGRARWFFDEEKLMGASSYGVGLGDWVVTQPDHWLYADTGMKKGDTIADLVGWEYHGPPLKDDPTLVVVAEGKFTDFRWEAESTHAATFYDGPKGNFVFNAGTCWWSMPLARPPGAVNPPDADFSKTDPRVQQMTKNLFERVVNAQSRTE